ncbi:MAG TPA: SpoIIE family protein phosphatase [Bryobacteraceae bacterium]|nr:SpoIIE family protein phosphatase [Bryobacteraceae bacterium]
MAALIGSLAAEQALVPVMRLDRFLDRLQFAFREIGVFSIAFECHARIRHNTGRCKRRAIPKRPRVPETAPPWKSGNSRIISPMGAHELPFGIERSLLRLDGNDPYLCLHFVIVFVRDQKRSLRFYVETLGFRVLVDHTFENGRRWIQVSPPDGNANIGLAPIPDGADAESLIGQETRIWFITEDVQRKYEEWRARGVQFRFPPQVPVWGGIHTRFEDPDGNCFGLAGFDELTRGVEAKRQALARQYEAERRAAQEIEIARQVQARLFPQVHPEVKTLEYAGVCLQARQVGGDYFDFIDLGQQRLGLVIGDVSGKGIAAALLMANLQANVRGQSALALTQPERFLCSVNQLFYANSAESAYASLFFAEYDSASRRLRYANCGHLSGLILRSDDQLCRLDATATLVGLFPDWECSFAEFPLAPGDLLALYTDGITEAVSDLGEEFGEENLIEALRRHRDQPCQTAVDSIAEEVCALSPGNQQDDITLILARCRCG